MTGRSVSGLIWKSKNLLSFTLDKSSDNMPESVHDAVKDGHTLRENLGTQPLVKHRIFNNTNILTEGWFVVAPSRSLAVGEARSLVIFRQRIVVFRGADKQVRAFDAFCPHMGADLGNGRVIQNQLQCYFHQWRFDAAGEVCHIPCTKEHPKKARVNAYPVEEKYGYVWVYSAKEAPYSVPSPPGLQDDDVTATHVGSPTLYAHHHVMMANGIDLQHFSAVHNLDVEFDFEVDDQNDLVFDWNLEGEIPKQGFKNKFLRWLLGPKVGYQARFAGGSIVTLTYGPNQRFRGIGFRLPALHILWGCLPQTDGVSRVHIFIATKKSPGPFGWLKAKALVLLSLVLLVTLRDDDIKAFPNMRFNPKNLIQADRSVARFIQLTDKLPVSLWSGKNKAQEDARVE
jgi:nitrite reductase/ring-hydroxylating ferredoxin subunit